MTIFRSPRLFPYLLIAGAGMLASLILGRPEPVLAATPFLLVLLLVLGSRAPAVGVRCRLERQKALEGEEVVLELAFSGAGPGCIVTAELDLPPGIQLVQPPTPVWVDRGGTALAPARVRCQRWGAYRLGAALVQARGPLSARVGHQRLEPSLPLRVYPQPERVRSLLRPRDVQPRVGSVLARASGDGFEFADIRDFLPGDRTRHINWKASARRDRLQVNRYHLERSTDVVLFLDTFSEAARENTSTLDMAVRATMGVTERLLRHPDRVGLVSFGGVVRWLQPDTGARQLYRVVDVLLEAQLAFDHVWREIDVIPRRLLPAGAMIVALTPLLDRRTVHALLDLAGRGHDVAIVEISPLPFLRPASEAAGRLAERFWCMRMEALRHEYERMGVPVVTWSEGSPFESALEEMRRSRARSRLLRS